MEVEEETKSDEAMKEVKKKATKVSKVAKEKPPGKKEKASGIDEVIK